MTRKAIGWVATLGALATVIVISVKSDRVNVAASQGEVRDTAEAALQHRVLAARLGSESESPPAAGPSPGAQQTTRRFASHDARRIATANIETVLDLLALGRSTPSTPGEYEAARDRLAELVRDDDGALRQALDLYRRDFGVEPSSPLVAPLVRSRREGVVDHALDLLRSPETLDDRDAGLALLGAAKSDRTDVREALLPMLTSTEDVNVVLRALRGLQTPDGDPRAATAVVDRAMQLIEQHPEDEVRRQSYFTIGRWATDASQLDLVLAGLEEPMSGMRAGAVEALGMAHVTSPEIVDALLERMRSTDEHIMIRDQARRALLNLPVQPAVRDEAERFTAELRTLVQQGS